ncbi:hypothetical protein [Nitrincola alkalilacustris]|uniref:hypothetical protein n=1 Tax=Nitrincola alkalilacustris TaxID=1571224 RepID=UPI00197E2526|nr:hypothetical protein [Nitrincola alkalilacustris]
MIRYGFQRLVLLGSAGYQRAELPLDDAVSLIAPNNTGKTSLINALQFLLIINKQRMDFGSHDDSKTRRFYFPNNSAYILLEITLPQTGTVVFGCVGKGVSYDYEYFAYKGDLVVEDYRLPEGHLVQQPQLISHLATRGRSVYRYDASEFAKRIYGGRLNERRSEPDFTVFKLENSNDAQVFQQVLTRTLRLDKLASADVKKHLLQIFRRDLPDRNINFKQVWDEAFHDVNADRAQYEAANSQLALIQKMESFYEQRLSLRGKLVVWQTRVNEALSQWQDYYHQQITSLTEQEQMLEAQQKQQTERIKQLTRSQGDLERTIEQLEKENREQTQLQSRFSLVSSRAVMELQLDAIKRELYRVSAVLQQADGRTVAAIERALSRQKQHLDTLKQQKKNLDDNLYRSLGEQLSAEELDRLNRVLSEQAMVLSSEHFRVDLTELKRVLATATADRVELGGLSLSVARLQPGHKQLTEAALDEQIADTERELIGLEAQLAAAQSMEATRHRKQSLENEVQEAQQALADYDRLQSLLESAPERELAFQARTQELHQLNDELERFSEHTEALRLQREQVIDRQKQLQDQNGRIDRLRNNRLDLTEEFSYLKALPHHPWMAEEVWPLDELANNMRTFQQDCQALNQFNSELKAGIRELHAGGLTRFQYSEVEDQELKRIIEFSHQLPQEREALEKKARSAVVNVTASLRELRNGLLTFQSKMREFNRLIGHRRLSDLKTFKIEAEDESHLVEAINVLIAKAEQVETGDSFELFNQESVLDDTALDRAKQILIDEGNARHGLKVDDLFRLVFVVAKFDQEAETFQDIDSAASNGTVLMAKLVTGLAMLHLMQDKRHKLHAICYLDEALALDGRNQASLIETAHEFGFSLIFASPAPLTTVRYCVPIHHSDGANHISRDSWQMLEPLNSEGIR